MIITRKKFLTIAGASFLFSPRLISTPNPTEEVPSMLDHILLGCSNLQRGIDFVEQHTGVRATFGGVHPGRGTQNALLSLGTRRYLEIIAPDPDQHTGDPLAKKLQSLAEPRLVGWAAHPGDLVSLSTKLIESGIVAIGPTPGSRKRPNGKILNWQTLNLRDDLNGLLPFFIQWGKDSVHPSADAPTGCQLITFELATPDPAAFRALFAKLSLDAPIMHAETPQLRANIRGPKGDVLLTS